MRKEQQKRRCGDATMLRDNLAGLIEPMIARAGADPLARSSPSRTNRGMLQVQRGGNRRSEAILAQKFWLENGATGRKGKMARFCSDHCGSGLSCGWYRMAPESSDDRPPMPQKIPAPKGRNLCTNGERRSPFHSEPRKPLNLEIKPQ